MRSTGMVEQQESPYVGPRPFRPEEGGKFYGRAREAHELAHHWQANPVTVLCGPSGVGKTSLIHAGVLPLLDPDFADVLPIGNVSHFAEVPAALADGRNPLVLAVLSSWSPDEPARDLADLTISSFLRRRPRRRDTYGDPLLTLVAIEWDDDPLADPGGQGYGEDLLLQLSDALEADPALRLLLTLRDHQLPMLNHRDKPFKQVLEYHLQALDVEAALQAVRRPPARTGRAFAEEAARELVQSLVSGEAGAGHGRNPGRVEPLHLQVVCCALWNALKPDVRVVTVDHVRTHGDVAHALAEFCDQTIELVARDVFQHETDLLRTALRGAFIGDQGRRVPVAVGAMETAGLPNRVIRALAAHHVLSLEDLPAGGRHCLLAHDRLVPAVARDDPLELENYRHHAKTALRDGDFTRAAVHAEAALRRCGTDPIQRAEIESLRGDIEYRRGRPGEAVKRYEHAAALFQRVEGAGDRLAAALLAIGRTRILLGDFDLALSVLEAAARRRPADIAIQAQLARALWGDGHINGALDVLDALLAADGGADEARRARGEMLADLGRPQPALADLESAGPLSSPSTRSAYALALALQGRIGEAMEIAPAAEIQTDPAVLLRVARVHEAAGHPDVAAAVAARARDGRPPLPPHLEAEAERLVRGLPHFNSC